MTNNSPLNELQEIMTITSEECAELSQVCSKIMRKYSEKNELNKEWKEKLIEEAGDVYAMLEILVEHGYVRWIDLQERVVVKREKLKRWSSIITDDNQKVKKKDNA